MSEKKIRASRTFDLTVEENTWIYFMAALGHEIKEVIEECIRYAMESDEFNDLMKLAGEIKRQAKAEARQKSDREKSARQYKKKKRGGCGTP